MVQVKNGSGNFVESYNDEKLSNGVTQPHPHKYDGGAKDGTEKDHVIQTPGVNDHIVNTEIVDLRENPNNPSRMGEIDYVDGLSARDEFSKFKGATVIIDGLDMYEMRMRMVKGDDVEFDPEINTDLEWGQIELTVKGTGRKIIIAPDDDYITIQSGNKEYTLGELRERIREQQLAEPDFVELEKKHNWKDVVDMLRKQNPGWEAVPLGEIPTSGIELVPMGSEELGLLPKPASNNVETHLKSDKIELL
ncbi:MAG: hypothetical protein H6908_03030 [Hyphomicrobiales bacterium]|nr:hypothetical protein [Hyphomicrobiales bacterium]